MLTHNQLALWAVRIPLPFNPERGNFAVPRDRTSVLVNTYSVSLVELLHSRCFQFWDYRNILSVIGCYGCRLFRRCSEFYILFSSLSTLFHILLTYLSVLSRTYQFLFNYSESRTYVNFFFGILRSLIFYCFRSSFYFDLFFYTCITLSYITLYGYLLYFAFYFYFVFYYIWQNGLREVTRQLLNICR